MIALVAGVLLVTVAATSLAALLRLRGIVAFALGASLLAFAEVVAVSHAISVVDAYEKRWFLAAVALVALAAAAVAAIVRPPLPSLSPRVALRELRSDRLLVVLAVLVVAELAYVARACALHAAQRPRRADLPPHARRAVDPTGIDRPDRGHRRPAHQRVPAGRGDPPGSDDAPLRIGSLGRRSCSSSRSSPRCSRSTESRGGSASTVGSGVRRAPLRDAARRRSCRPRRR